MSSLSPEKIPILLVSSGIIHPNLIARRIFKRLLDAEDTFLIQQESSLEVLPNLDLEYFRAIILYIHQQKLSEKALERLELGVQAGVGLMAVHSASASFKDQPRYQHILGGRFKAHAAVENFWVDPLPSSRTIFGSIDKFRVRDEYYQHEVDRSIMVHFSAHSGDEHQSFVWTRVHGLGRVFYAAFGHTISSIRNPSVQRILLRGLYWCSGNL